MPTTEAALDNGFLRDVYVVIGDPQEGGRLGDAHLLQAAGQLDLGRRDPDGPGGALSLSDRRYRVAAGAAQGANRSGAGGAGGMRRLV